MGDVLFPDLKEAQQEANKRFVRAAGSEEKPVYGVVQIGWHVKFDIEKDDGSNPRVGYGFVWPVASIPVGGSPYGSLEKKSGGLWELSKSETSKTQWTVVKISSADGTLDFEDATPKAGKA